MAVDTAAIRGTVVDRAVITDRHTDLMLTSTVDPCKAAAMAADTVGPGPDFIAS